jgi:hypothetical protein
MCLEHGFNRVRKEEQRDLYFGKKKKDYSISKVSRKDKFRMFKEQQMIHEVYEQDPGHRKNNT